jgi:hypothetical protein
MKHSPAEEIKDDTSKISSARNQAHGSALAAGLKTQDQIEKNETGPALVAKGALTQENPERFKENQRIRREKKMCAAGVVSSGESPNQTCSQTGNELDGEDSA